MSTETEMVRIGGTVPKHVADEIARRAEAADRSFAAELRVALRHWVARDDDERQAA